MNDDRTPMADTLDAAEQGSTALGSTALGSTALWSGDTGALSEQSRRAVLALVKGPYLSGVKSPGLWSSLLADELVIRSRLHELFLDLVIDRIGEFAFVRNVAATEIKLPSTVRTNSLSFLDTAMLLVLRQMLLAAESDGRVIVGQEDVFEQLRVYRTPDRDESDFNSRLNSSWQNMKNKLRVIHPAGSDDRAEISPVVRLIVDADQVRSIAAEYRRIAQVGAVGSVSSVGSVGSVSSVGSVQDAAAAAPGDTHADTDSGPGEENSE